jgi:stearoyl-CoA desaturase (delta-9 desaturase)
MLGLVTELQRMPLNEIEKKRVQVVEEEIADQKKHIQYPPDDSVLPHMTMSELQKKVENYRKEKQQKQSKADDMLLIVLDGYVLDVTKFQHEHPGGAWYFKAFNGRDCTEAFHGGVNTHTVGSSNYAMMFRVAKLVDEQ